MEMSLDDDIMRIDCGVHSGINFPYNWRKTDCAD
jgi:hypothetical protein